jgi:hypothetical protein
MPSLSVVNLTSFAESTIIYTEIIAIEKKQCVLLIVALQKSLPTIRKTLRSSCKVLEIFVLF